ncbi:hypothetical protein [Streptomyces geranii]|uniref:hypothetical protein n=1 Tax=Streptomyces geranii TaxID=2058923 RepID=UPI000D03BF30|nr:hypothetical protein [Streptomyces geranii]
MFRLTARLAAVLTRRRTPDPPAAPTLTTHAPRTPDPYVWTLPTPHHARWRRWHRRRSPTTPHLPDEDCWQALAITPLPLPPPPSANWTTTDDVVRPYVLRAFGEGW